MLASIVAAVRIHSGVRTMALNPQNLVQQYCSQTSLLTCSVMDVWTLAQVTDPVAIVITVS